LSAHDDAGNRQDAAYLAQAFNSCRLFAFCERALFGTPYSFGNVRVSTLGAAAIQLIQGGAVVFRAEMADAREPLHSGADGWQGPIFLPRNRRKKNQDKLFFGRITGHTQTYPFLQATDMLMIRPSPGTGILQALIDSHLVVHEWAVREDATHAKSKTYARSEVIAKRPGS
jgi:hypothetical protein